VGELKGKVEAVQKERDAVKGELDKLKAQQTLALREAKKKVEDLSTKDAEDKVKAAQEAFQENTEPLSADGFQGLSQEKAKEKKQKVTDATAESKTLKTNAADAAEEAMRTSLPVRLTEGILEIMLESMKRDPNIVHVRLFWQRREKRAREGASEAEAGQLRQRLELQTCRLDQMRAEKAKLEAEAEAGKLQQEVKLQTSTLDRVKTERAELETEAGKLRKGLEQQTSTLDRVQTERTELEDLLEQMHLATLMVPVKDIEGIGEKYAQDLEGKAGITTIKALLESCASREQRAELAAETGISPKLILNWANMADLLRVAGVSEEDAELLEAAGVDTVPELAQRNPENLFHALEKANQQRKMVDHPPTLEQVKSWIAQAKGLPRILTY
jgi:hypothetical protein